jgi:hypothetical protein
MSKVFAGMVLVQSLKAEMRLVKGSAQLIREGGGISAPPENPKKAAVR